MWRGKSEECHVVKWRTKWVRLVKLVNSGRHLSQQLWRLHEIMKSGKFVPAWWSYPHIVTLSSTAFSTSAQPTGFLTQWEGKVPRNFHHNDSGSMSLFLGTISDLRPWIASQGSLQPAQQTFADISMMTKMKPQWMMTWNPDASYFDYFILLVLLQVWSQNHTTVNLICCHSGHRSSDSIY